MSEAEKSIAVKKKIAIAKPINREDSPSEVYTPKRRKSEAAEVSPPPYIPSKKESSSVRSRISVEEKHCSSPVKEDARMLLSSRERGELISRSRRMELLQKMGLERKETGNERGRLVRDKEECPSDRKKDEGKSGKTEIKNFRITAHVAPSTRLSETAKERLAKALEQSERSLQVTVVPRSASSQKGSLASRLGKIVVQRRSTDRSREEESEDLRNKVTLLPKRRRLALSLLGKEAVKKQCEAAVLSVKSSGLRKYVRKESQDCRVVESHVSSDDEEPPKYEKASDDSVEVSKESDDVVVRDSIDKDSEDLDDMLKDDVDPDLEDSLQDEFTLDLDDEDDLIKVVGQLEEEDLIQTKDKTDRTPGTRFIVTLDGVDERQFEGNLKSNFVDPLAPIQGPAKPIVQQTQQVTPMMLPKPLEQTPFALPQDPSKLVSEQMLTKPAPPKIQPFSINLKDSDDEIEDKGELKDFSKLAGFHHAMQPVISESGSLPLPMDATEGLTTLQKAKQMERCKFWPACAAGSECEFHHPTSYCKTFPNCKFGDKCLFIHPNCKFDSKCSRPDCPFTHTSRRPAVTSAPFKPSMKQPYYPQYIPFSNSTQSTVCKFFPNCQNINCSFFHPKTCRFGATCQNQSCPFYHPAPPTPTPRKDKLKWTAQMQTQADPQAGQGKSTPTIIPTQSSHSKPSPVLPGPVSSISSVSNSSSATVSSTSV